MTPEYAARRFREKSHAWLGTGLARCPYCGDVPRVSRDYGGLWNIACCEDYDCEDGKYRLVGGLLVREFSYEDAWAEWNDRALEVER